MTNESTDNDVTATNKTVPPTANTGAIATMGLELQERRVIPRKQIFSWALWDWATQPFNTVILTFILLSVGASPGLAIPRAVISAGSSRIAKPTMGMI